MEQLDGELEKFVIDVQQAAWSNTPQLRRRTVGNSYPTEVREVIAEKRRARKKWQKTRTSQDKRQLNHLTQQLRREIQQIKNESILGPLLFIIYMNDLPGNIEDESTTCYMYADDVYLNIVTDLNRRETLLNGKLELMSDWCNANKLALNLNKTLNLSVSYNILNSGHSVKFLGINIQDNMKWKCHIDCTIPKVARGVFILRR